jgi:hypothetical protein
MEFAANKILRFTLRLFILTMGIAASGRSQSINPTKMFSVCLEVGNWQPQSLNESPVFSTFGKAGATPFYCGGLSFPLGKEMGFQFTAGFWSLRDIEKVHTVHSLTLHSLHADFKYWLVPDFRLSAYVLYGAGIYWGVENENQPFGKSLGKAKPGWGANLGAGSDLALSRRIGLGMVFQYHFIRFKKPLGGVNDFSGPKIGVEIFYFL